MTFFNSISKLQELHIDFAHKHNSRSGWMCALPLLYEYTPVCSHYRVRPSWEETLQLARNRQLKISQKPEFPSLLSLFASFTFFLHLSQNHISVNQALLFATTTNHYQHQSKNNPQKLPKQIHYSNSKS